MLRVIVKDTIVTPEEGAWAGTEVKSFDLDSMESVLKLEAHLQDTRDNCYRVSSIAGCEIIDED